MTPCKRHRWYADPKNGHDAWRCGWCGATTTGYYRRGRGVVKTGPVVPPR